MVPLLHPPMGKAAAIAAAVRGAVPPIATPRLRLRAPLLADFPAYSDVMTSDRARHMGGPFSEAEAFADFCQGIAGWMLCGAGMWTVTARDAEEPLGWIYLWQEFGDPEPELGWILVKAAEGRGYAIEAARAVLPHAVEIFGAGRFVSYIDPENPRSCAVAERLGAVREPVTQDDCLVYRHFAPKVTA